MPIIRTHDYTLYGSHDIDIVLRPLCDDHLPLLYRWNADPELLYWTEGGEDLMRSYDRETVPISTAAYRRMPIAFWSRRTEFPSVNAGFSE